MLLYNFFIHLSIKTIPSITFTLPCQFYLLHLIICRNLLICIFCTDFTWSLCTIYILYSIINKITSLYMTHCTTILTCTFSESICLKTFLTTLIPLFHRNLLWYQFISTLSFTIIITSIPWHLFYEFWSVLNVRHCY